MRRLLSAGLLAVVAGVLPAASHAADDTAHDMVMEIVPLQHRLLGEVLPMLRELVLPGGTVTGMNDRLILRSTPANLAELKRVLASLDTPARQLRITVRQNIGARNQWQNDALAARLEAGEVGVASGRLPPPGTPGAALDLGNGDGSIGYRHYGTQGSADAANTHFVTAIEGTPAFINTGQVVPLPSQSAVLTPYGAVVQQSLDYQPVGAGFYVTPRVAGDNVHLDISPYADRLSAAGGGVIDVHGLDTSASGRLGEWIPLGGAATAYRDQQQEVLAGTRRQGSDAYDVWVKVEVLP